MKLLGADILVRTLSKPRRIDTHGNCWSYLSRSDHHSKVACWGIVFDLLRTSSFFRKHVEAGTVGFGINHEIRDFKNDRKKDLDLVIGLPTITGPASQKTLTSLAKHYAIELTEEEQGILENLPALHEAQLGNVLIALEAKACMTEHQKALPRLYDELNSSHLTVHGAHDTAIAAAFVMVNAANKFLSSDKNKKNFKNSPEWTKHNQPKSVKITIDKVQQLPRRSRLGTDGYDALAIVAVNCVNDGSAVTLYTQDPAPQPRSLGHYSSMIERLRAIYDTRFAQL